MSVNLHILPKNQFKEPHFEMVRKLLKQQKERTLKVSPSEVVTFLNEIVFWDPDAEKTVSKVPYFFEYYYIEAVLVYTVVQYRTHVPLEIRTRFMEILMSRSGLINMKLWVYMFFANLDDCLKYKVEWLHFLKVIFDGKTLKQQRIISYLILVRINRHFREFSYANRKIIMDMLLLSSERWERLKIVSKHYEYISWWHREKALSQFLKDHSIPKSYFIGFKDKEIRDLNLKNQIVTICKSL